MRIGALGFLLVGVMSTGILSSVHAQQKNSDGAPAKSASQRQDDGQKVFGQNCSRCHNAPEGFSPRISATIVRHMRVRANLSKGDEQKLLRFFNP